MADSRDKRRGLGRGLSALMADVGQDSHSEAQTGSRAAEKLLPIEQVHPNPDQPRRRFDDEDLKDLAASIKEKGIIQPLIVRPRTAGGFEIVAGERRWRAAQLSKLHELPVIVRNFDDTEVLEIAIIENIQRADLNAIEEASGYAQLMSRFGHTQEKLAEALGKSRSHIANLMRLLSLPETVLEFVRDGRLSAGHARALIVADNPIELAKKVIKDGLSVRATERLVKSAGSNGPENVFKGDARPAAKAEKDADTRALEGDLSAALGMSVSVDHQAGKETGQMVIRYKDFEQLDHLCRLLSSA